MQTDGEDYRDRKQYATKHFCHNQQAQFYFCRAPFLNLLALLGAPARGTDSPVQRDMCFEASGERIPREQLVVWSGGANSKDINGAKTKAAETPKEIALLVFHITKKTGGPS